MNALGVLIGESAATENDNVGKKGSEEKAIIVGMDARRGVDYCITGTEHSVRSTD